MGRSTAAVGSAWQVTTPAPRQAWDEVVEADPTAFVYQTPAGLDALCTEHGARDASRLYEFEDGQRLVLPMYRTAGPAWLASQEKTSKTGSIVAARPLRRADLLAVSADLAHRRLLRTVVRPSVLHPPEVWSVLGASATGSNQRITHILDLEGGFDHVTQHRFKQQARRAIRKAERASIEVVRDHGEELVPTFRQLWAQSVERWSERTGPTEALYRWRASRRDPTQRLSVLARTVGSRFSIWLARVDGQPAASIVVLQGPNAHYIAGAMDIELAGPARASFLLQKLAIEQACSDGCRYYHFGETGNNEGLARFKSQFGAAEYRAPDFWFERLPITSTSARARQLARRVMVRR